MPQLNWGSHKTIYHQHHDGKELFKFYGMAVTHYLQLRCKTTKVYFKIIFNNMEQLVVQALGVNITFGWDNK